MTDAVLLVTSSSPWRETVEAASRDAQSRIVSVEGSDPQSLLREVKVVDPLVVAVGPDLPLEDAIALCRAVDEEHPEICVVLVARPEAAVFEQALRAGVRDLLDPGSAPHEVAEVLDRARETARRRRSTIVTAQDSGPRSRIIAIVSPKGGAGKTAISTNLGVGLAQQHAGAVVVLDLDVRFGDVGHALRLLPERTLSDVAPMGGAIDPAALKASLTPHPSGLFVLCAPDSPADADDIPASTIGTIIEALSTEFPYVILDTPAGLDEVTLTAMERATDLVLVCGTDVASTRSMRKEIEAFDQIGLTTQRRHFVLNRADARVGLEVRDIEGTVGMAVNVAIPSSRSVPLSMNQGSPILESQPRSPVARAYGELVNRFAAAPAEPVAAPAAATSTAANVARFRRRKDAR